MAYLLDYNRDAHEQGFGYLNRLSSSQGELTSQLGKVVLNLGAIVEGPKVPIVEVPEVLFESHEIDAAYDTAQQLNNLLQQFSQAPQVAQPIPAPAPPQVPLPVPDPTASPSYALIIVGAIIVIALLALLIYAYNRAHNNPSKYEMLLEQYGDPVLAQYLADAGLTDEQCQELINRFGLLKLQELAEAFQSRGVASTDTYFRNLYQARNLPGIDNLVDDLINSGDNISGFQGSLYELWWIGEHANEISQVQISVTLPTGQTAKGPDALLQDGTVIQLKAYHWGIGTDRLNVQRIIDQVRTARAGGFGTNPIRFEIWSLDGCLSVAAIAQLRAAGIYPATAAPSGATVTWEYWPQGAGYCQMPPA